MGSWKLRRSWEVFRLILTGKGYEGQEYECQEDFSLSAERASVVNLKTSKSFSSDHVKLTGEKKTHKQPNKTQFF